MTDETATSLALYRAQRDQIISVISSDPDADPSLSEVVNSLTELIVLLEEAQESSRDARDLLPQTNSSEISTSEPENSVERNAQDVDPALRAVEDELHESLHHMQCRVPFQHNWGQLRYSNALVQSVDATPVSDDVDEVVVRVLFLQPTHRSMVPCKFYMDGRCRFESCHYSHGELYPLSKLKPYEPPDYTKLAVGSLCLCKGEEGLWEHGTVVDLKHGGDAGEDEFRVVVRVQGEMEPRELEVHQIVPEKQQRKAIESSGTENVLSSSLRVERAEDGDSSCDSEDEFVPHSAWSAPVVQVGSVFGSWESHTKGFASMMMSRMGYTVGQSLGNRPGGRIEPIIAEVLPKGRSLDYCMELREQKDFVKVGAKRKERGKRKLSFGVRSSREKKDVFAFLNSQMNTPEVFDVRKDFSGEARSSEKTSQAKSVKMPNSEVLKLHDRISTLESDLNRLNSSLRRNQSSNKAAAKLINGKISMKETELSGLRRRLSHFQQERDKEKDKKSMSVF